MTKKWISGIAIALACVSLVACGGGKSNGDTESSNKPNSSTGGDSANRTYNLATTLLNYDEKENDLNMDIYAYYPDNTATGMQLAKEAGITDFLLTRNGEYITTNPDAVQHTIDLAAEAGIKCFPFTGHIAINSDDQLKAEWLYSDNISGIYYYDEPFMPQLPDLGNRVEFFEKNFPGKTFLVALQPASVTSHPLWAANDGTGINYEEYITTYCNEVFDRMGEGTKKVLMADCYPIKKEKNELSIKPSHLYNLMELAAQAKDNGAIANLAIQTLEHTVSSGATLYPAPTLQSMRFQIYPLLSFGFKAYTLYTYDTRPDAYQGDVMIEENIMGLVENGRATATYPIVKQVNKEILSFDHVYLSFDWEGIIPVVPTKDQRTNFQQLTGFGRYVLEAQDTKVLNEITSDNNILCGVFQDEAGNEAYAITNYCAPWLETVAKTQLTFDGCDKAIVYLNGEKSVMNLTDGKLALSLNACDGAFVIPYKA